MDRAKRILHVVGGMTRGGVETMLMNLYREIDREKLQFDFLCLRDGKFDYDDEILQYGGKIIHIDQPKALHWLKAIQDIRKAIIKNGPYFAVHSHVLHFSGLSLLAARLAGIKKRIAHAHSTSSQKDSQFDRIIYYKLMRFLIRLCATDYVACGRDAGRFLYGNKAVLQGQVEVLPNAIDLKRYLNLDRGQAQGKRKELSIPTDCLVIGHVGRFVPVKNQVFLIKLAQELSKTGKNFRVVLVGDGELRTKVETKIRVAGLSAYFLVLGVRTDIPELMNMFDVFVMPSLYEGLPVTLIEAQAAGVPCVVSSTITKEADLNLGRVVFVDLEAETQWLSEIERMAQLQAGQKDLISQAFLTKGYRIDDSVRKLEAIYGR